MEAGPTVLRESKRKERFDESEERRQAMDEIVDMNTMFDLTKGGDDISAVELLLNEFEAHEEKEEKSVEQYRKMLEDMKNPVNRFVLQLIISDEEKHRAVTHAMVSTLKGSLTWTKPEGSLETGADDVAANNGKLLAVTEEFINLEKEGVKEYKSLVKESTDYYHGVFQILLNSMIRDSEKHIELLQFLRQRLREQ